MVVDLTNLTSKLLSNRKEFTNKFMLSMCEITKFGLSLPEVLLKELFGEEFF
jgi:hypothetical protein